MKFKNINFVEAIEELANIQGVSIPRDQADDQKYRLEIKKIKEINEIAKIFFQRQLIKNNDKYDYLVNTRKIKKDVIEKYQLGCTGYQYDSLYQYSKNKLATIKIDTGLFVNKNNRYSDKFKDRVIFPIHNKKGETIGFGGRTTKADINPKYLNSPTTMAFNKSLELYGLYECIKFSKSYNT